MLSKIKKWLNGGIDNRVLDQLDVEICRATNHIKEMESEIDRSEREWMDNECKAYAASLELRRRVSERAAAGEASQDQLEVLKAILYVVRMGELRMSTKPKPTGYDEWLHARGND